MKQIMKFIHFVFGLENNERKALIMKEQLLSDMRETTESINKLNNVLKNNVSFDIFISAGGIKEIKKVVENTKVKPLLYF